MENFDVIEPDIVINQDEAAALAAIMVHPGFKVVQKISRSCVDSFIQGWINKETDEEIIRAHRHAKVAAQLYTMQLRRMRNVVDEYMHLHQDEKPIDVTESLDIGEFVKPGTEDTDEEPLFG
jgi:hypothetical protein